ncbi:MAG TPA: hypothetical protein PLZ79_10855 [Burkholderiales bacterium]|nr:hypothetical protein [Betaproteobacteria bacterium]HQR53760.1 hypothetical protein [Burkholderiales bacterium]
MRNPWTKKNPFMSMWLSGVNAAMGRGRGHAAAAFKRETRKATAALATAGMNQVMDFWKNALKPPTVRRKRRRSR